VVGALDFGGAVGGGVVIGGIGAGVICVIFTCIFVTCIIGICCVLPSGVSPVVSFVGCIGVGVGVAVAAGVEVCARRFDVATGAGGGAVCRNEHDAGMRAGAGAHGRVRAGAACGASAAAAQVDLGAATGPVEPAVRRREGVLVLGRVGCSLGRGFGTLPVHELVHSALLLLYAREVLHQVVHQLALFFNHKLVLLNDVRMLN